MDSRKCLAFTVSMMSQSCFVLLARRDTSNVSIVSPASHRQGCKYPAQGNAEQHNIYQSQNRDRSVSWTVKLSSPVDANIDLDSIEIGEVGLLKRSLVDMTENIDFELVDDTLMVKVTIKDTSALNAGKSYTLPLLIKAEGCATDAGASKLSLKLTVKK